MDKWSVVLVSALFLSIAAFSQQKGKDCDGFFRWNVKTLTDSGSIALLSLPVTDSTLSHLVSVHPPKHFFVLSKKDGRLPRFEDEKQVVRMVAIIEDVKLQKDQDLHIILKSPDSDETMIGEIPDPSCRIFESSDELRKTYLKARQELEQAEAVSRTTGKPVLVEITGVPFWDARHWWLRGCARNGREIHPILSVKLLSP